MMGEGSGIKNNIERVLEDIHNTCAHCGRQPESVRLMAVSKFHPLESVREAFNCGLKLFGENRVQEARSKFKERSAFPGMELHLIGSLQRNKAKHAALFFDCIESVDRSELIGALSCFAGERAEPLPVLLEVNSGEESKRGYKDIESLFDAAEELSLTRSLKLQGLMTMAPNTEDEKIIRAAFRALMSAKIKIESEFKIELPVVSMGMSGDYKIAIEEGSTLLRVGTAIFGERAS